MGKSSTRVGNVGAMLKVLGPLSATSTDPAQKNRKLLADFCRLVGGEIGMNGKAPADLSPRLRQTLTSLLNGASEKQIAQALGLSQHTIHVYVKQSYRRYRVSSRGELLALWAQR